MRLLEIYKCAVLTVIAAILAFFLFKFESRRFSVPIRGSVDVDSIQGTVDVEGKVDVGEVDGTVETTR